MFVQRFLRRVAAEPYIVFLGILVTLVIFIVVVPLLLLLLSSFSGTRPGVIEELSLNGYSKAYLDPRTYLLAKNTFIYAGGATLFGLIFGTILAWLVERTNMPLRNVAFATVPLTIVIPGVLSSMAWIFLLSPNTGFINKSLMLFFNRFHAPFNIFTLSGMCYVQGLSFTGSVFLMMVPAFRGLDPALEEAAATSGAGILSTLHHITLRLMVPALLSSAIYIGVVGISVFDVPAMIGMPNRITVFSTKLYLASHGYTRDFGLAGALSVGVLLLSFIGIYFYSRLTRQTESYATITGKGYRPRMIDLGLWKHIALVFFLTYLIIAIILPILTLVWVSLLPYLMPPSWEALPKITLNSYREVLEYGPVKLAITNTLIMMVTAATITMIISYMISWIVIRTHLPGRRILDLLVFLPHGISGIVIGLALIWVYLTLRFIPIYGTIWIIALAFITRYISFGTRTTNAAMLQLHRELEEAGRISGASWIRVVTRITLPLLTPAFINGWLFVAVHSMRDLSAPIMLATGKSIVLAVVIFDLWNEGRATYAAAVAVMLVFFIMIFVFLARIIGYRIGRIP